jgi:membrane protease YdiL (CAAX protease family)
MIWALVPLFWAACLLAGYLYTQDRGVPWSMAQTVAPAFLLEATLFLSVGVERWRTRLEKLPPWAVAVLLVAAAIAPYSAAALATGTFGWAALAALAALAAMLSFWYVALPHTPLSDIGLLVLAAAVIISKVFGDLYIRPHPGLNVEALGQAMWIRTGLFAMLSVRRMQGVGFGFWPSPREWKTGTLHFLVLLPAAAALGWRLNFTRPHAPESDWPTMLPLTFFGTLWVLALSEEFFFRGLLQQWLSGWLKSAWAGWIAASALFGFVHVWYGQFPNWRFAALAGVAGLFYGSAFRIGNGIRASMVTHALTVTAWRIFFA